MGTTKAIVSEVDLMGLSSLLRHLEIPSLPEPPDTDLMNIQLVIMDMVNGDPEVAPMAAGLWSLAIEIWAFNTQKQVWDELDLDTDIELPEGASIRVILKNNEPELAPPPPVPEPEPMVTSRRDPRRKTANIPTPAPVAHPAPSAPAVEAKQVLSKRDPRRKIRDDIDTKIPSVQSEYAASKNTVVEKPKPESKIRKEDEAVKQVSGSKRDPRKRGGLGSRPVAVREPAQETKKSLSEAPRKMPIIKTPPQSPIPEKEVSSKSEEDSLTPPQKRPLDLDIPILPGEGQKVTSKNADSDSEGEGNLQIDESYEDMDQKKSAKNESSNSTVLIQERQLADTPQTNPLMDSKTVEELRVQSSSGMDDSFGLWDEIYGVNEEEPVIKSVKQKQPMVEKVELPFVPLPAIKEKEVTVIDVDVDENRTVELKGKTLEQLENEKQVLLDLVKERDRMNATMAELGIPDDIIMVKEIEEGELSDSDNDSVVEVTKKKKKKKKKKRKSKSADDELFSPESPKNPEIDVAIDESEIHVIPLERNEHSSKLYSPKSNPNPLYRSDSDVEEVPVTVSVQAKKDPSNVTVEIASEDRYKKYWDAFPEDIREQEKVQSKDDKDPITSQIEDDNVKGEERKKPSRESERSFSVGWAFQTVQKTLTESKKSNENTLSREQEKTMSDSWAHQSPQSNLSESGGEPPGQSFWKGKELSVYSEKIRERVQEKFQEKQVTADAANSTVTSGSEHNSMTMGVPVSIVSSRESLQGTPPKVTQVGGGQPVAALVSPKQLNTNVPPPSFPIPPPNMVKDFSQIPNFTIPPPIPTPFPSLIPTHVPIGIPTQPPPPIPTPIPPPIPTPIPPMMPTPVPTLIPPTLVPPPIPIPVPTLNPILVPPMSISKPPSLLDLNLPKPEFVAKSSGKCDRSSSGKPDCRNSVQVGESAAKKAELDKKDMMVVNRDYQKRRELQEERRSSDRDRRRRSRSRERSKNRSREWRKRSRSRSRERRSYGGHRRDRGGDDRSRDSRDRDTRSEERSRDKKDRDSGTEERSRDKKDRDSGTDDRSRDVRDRESKSEDRHRDSQDKAESSKSSSQRASQEDHNNLMLCFYEGEDCMDDPGDPDLDTSSVSQQLFPDPVPVLRTTVTTTSQSSLTATTVNSATSQSSVTATTVNSATSQSSVTTTTVNSVTTLSSVTVNSATSQSSVTATTVNSVTATTTVDTEPETPVLAKPVAAPQPPSISKAPIFGSPRPVGAPFPGPTTIPGAPKQSGSPLSFGISFPAPWPGPPQPPGSSIPGPPEPPSISGNSRPGVPPTPGEVYKATLGLDSKHPVSALHEFSSRMQYPQPRFTERWGPGGGWAFDVTVGPRTYSSPWFKSKKRDARVEAAKYCLIQLGINLKF